MRRLWVSLVLLSWFAGFSPAQAATGQVVKVLPEFLDLKGRNSLSPSLYERDAYQAVLRKTPQQRSGLRYFVQWKAKDAAGLPLKLRLELRGVPEGNQLRYRLFDKELETPGRFSRWSEFNLAGDDYKQFGPVTAWRVTLWAGRDLIGEQKSFLW